MKYCKKHNQEYYENLPLCPICAGEALAENPIPHWIKRDRKQKLVTRTITKKKGLLR